MSSKPWYREGLSFSCTRCGDCCTGAPGYVWVEPTEIDALAKHFGLSVDNFGERYLRKVGRRYSLIEKPGGDCVFFDKGCSVYPARPTQCRTFPFWRSNLKSERAWDELADECPGIGQGKLFPVEEIEVLKRGKAETPAGE
ncbi:MAG: YkgJ family cysteine cluster protein [Planctomycetota bacterium]|nr:YkgJ family cysteine cluster protein [Planctomycetota bacterium]